MDWTLELIVVPVSDIDRAKAFYVDGMGFRQLVDVMVGETTRVVQLNPPGSACAIAEITTFGPGRFATFSLPATLWRAPSHARGDAVQDRARRPLTIRARTSR